MSSKKSIYTPEEEYVIELMHKKHFLKNKFNDMFYGGDPVERNEVWKEYMVINKKLDAFFGGLKQRNENKNEVKLDV